MTDPLLSIVIANYNYGRFLEEAIQSVIVQGVEGQVELIICDAASTDNSVEIIKKYANGLPPKTHRSEWSLTSTTPPPDPLASSIITWWCSEKDGGQSAAFNKGFSHAKGRFLTWLNADDLLIDGCLRKVISEIVSHPRCEWFTGNLIRFLEDERRICDIGWGPHCYPGWLQKSNSPIVVFGPTSFFSKKVLDQAGGFDESLHYVMDTDVWLKFMHMGIKQRRVNCFCWAFRMHCNSKTAEFGSHRPSDTACRIGDKESLLIRSRVNYRQSSVLRMLYVLLRILDGSYLVQLVLKFILNKRAYGK